MESRSEIRAQYEDLDAQRAALSMAADEMRQKVMDVLSTNPEGESLRLSVGLLADLDTLRATVQVLHEDIVAAHALA